MHRHSLAGIYVAALTPLKPDHSPDLDAIPALLAYYVAQGCHGALLLGTTGEGPSFSATERVQIFKAGLEIRATHPDFKLLAGTAFSPVWLMHASTLASREPNTAKPSRQHRPPPHQAA